MNYISKLEEDLKFERARAAMYHTAYQREVSNVAWWAVRCNKFERQIEDLRQENYILKCKLDDYEAGLI